MNFKRISAGALALTMTAALGANALAADKPEGWTPADGARGPMLISARVNYQHQLFLNDEELDTAAIPAVEGQQLPMRLLAEADGGSAEWYEEDNQGMFFLGDQAIVVNFADGSVEVGFEKVENVTATVIEGVTFLPADFVNSLEGIEVNLNEEMDVDRIDVATPNGTPIMKLANAIRETAEMGMSMKQTAAELEEVWSETHGFKAEYVTEGVFFLGMMTTPDTLALGKVAEGKEEDLKAALPKVENAQFVTEGEWFMFIIAENAEAAVEQFKTAVAEMDKAEAEGENKTEAETDAEGQTETEDQKDDNKTEA